ncbi:MAG: hypothetical protein ACRDUB_20710 [Mycobacterium sp.]
MSNETDTADIWTTVSVASVRGQRALYECEGAWGGCIARHVPAVLLQENQHGRRRSVFSVAVGAELVPVDHYDQFVSIVTASVWEVAHGHLGWGEALLEREKAKAK